jgi:hypothetical protein
MITLFVDALGNLMPAWKRERDPCIDVLTVYRGKI